jgi:UDP-N-acetylglucosamine 1-carboxyvinyltransferase
MLIFLEKKHMDCMKVLGGSHLKGAIRVSGAKNAVLPLMALCLMTDEPVTLENVPALEDVRMMGLLLESLGCHVEFGEGSVYLHAQDITNTKADYEIVRKMRASILVLGPLLARMGHAEVSLPGGCNIGPRPVNFHIEALQKLGTEFYIQNGYIHGLVSAKKLSGGHYVFPKISVTGTMNALMAAVLAEGETCLENAAQEPEIVDLANCLLKMGACIEGQGTSTLKIRGVSRLSGAQHRVLPDRIEMGTYMIAAAITQGDLVIQDGDISLLSSLVDVLTKAGVTIQDLGRDAVRVFRTQPLKPVHIQTAPYPGFPTDLQAQMLALACISEGTSSITENIFENRFMHTLELIRMGAQIQVEGHTAMISGVPYLSGAPVMATDLRASVSLVLAGLVAQGMTVVRRIYHLDRGYEGLENKLAACGASIERVKVAEVKLSDESQDDELLRASPHS